MSDALCAHLVDEAGRCVRCGDHLTLPAPAGDHVSDQPTNHRAQAERWLIEAVSHVNHGAEGFAISGALIGIGHWLGAIHDALLAGIDVLAEDEPLDEQCRWHTDGNDWALWSGPPAVARCIRYTEHEGPHERSTRTTTKVTDWHQGGTTTVTNDRGEAIVVTEPGKPGRFAVTGRQCTYVENPGSVQLRCDLEWAHDGSHRMRLNP